MTEFLPSKNVRRSKHFALVGGVCSGLALTYGWSISLTRLIALLLSGPGVIIYLAAWILIPEESNGDLLPAPQEDPLRRVQRGKMLAGVCMGLAKVTGIDVSMIRIALVISVLFGGIGLVPYIFAWLVIPTDKQFLHDENVVEL